MNNLENVRKCMRIKHIPNDAGTKLTIEFTYYDNGLFRLMGPRKATTHRMKQNDGWRLLVLSCR
jgi:hypothetical protein